MSFFLKQKLLSSNNILNNLLRIFLQKSKKLKDEIKAVVRLLISSIRFLTDLLFKIGQKLLIPEKNEFKI